MTRFIKKVAVGFFGYVLRSLVGALIGVSAFLLCLLAYNSAVPVTFAMIAEPYTRAESDVVLNVRGYKIRNCEVIGDSFIGWYRNVHGDWSEAHGHVTFPNDTSEASNRPASWLERQNFGLFKISGITSVTREVRVTVNHVCRDDTVPRITVLGPWKIDNY